MQELLNFFMIWNCIYAASSAITYDVEDLCMRNRKSTPRNFLLHHFFPRRQFAGTLDLAPGETIIIVLGNIPSRYLATSLKPKHGATNPMHYHFSTMASNQSEPESVITDSILRRTRSADIDCRFSVKTQKQAQNLTFFTEWWGMNNNCTNFLQLIHGPDMILIRMIDDGNQAFTSALYFSLHVRISVCHESYPQAGLILMISMPGKENAYGETVRPYSTSTLLAFLTPCVVLLLIVGSAALGCCCCANVTCFQRIDNATRDVVSVAAEEHRASAIALGQDKPPAYEELFPSAVNLEMIEMRSNANKDEESPPPAYENLRPEQRMMTET